MAKRRKSQEKNEKKITAPGEGMFGMVVTYIKSIAYECVLPKG